MYFGFQNIHISYGKKEVLRDLTLEIPRGGVVTVIGQNGCGKSSLLKTVCRSVTPQAGQVIYERRPLFSLPPRERARKIAYLPQVHTSPPDIDAWTLVSYGRFPHSKFGRSLAGEDRRIIRQALEITGLGAFAERKLQTMSGGSCIAIGHGAGGNLEDYLYHNAVTCPNLSPSLPVSRMGRVVQPVYRVLDQLIFDLQKGKCDLAAYDGLIRRSLLRKLSPLLEQLCGEGLMLLEGSVIRFTEEGLFWGNNIIDEMIRLL